MKKYIFYLLLIIIFIGGFLRIYNGAQLFDYTHDQDLAGWIIKDVLFNHHLRLIGQLTSTPGVFIGPLFYYLLIPFYLLFKMDPIGGIYLVMILGMFTIWSVYYVFKEVFDEETAIIGAFIYSVSPYTIFNDKRVVPTMPLMLWSVWFLYSLFLIAKGNQKKGFLIASILIALIWHINFGLAILLPLYLVALYLSKKRIDFKAFIYAGIFTIILSLPLILFEVRHGFSQTSAIFFSATKSQGDVIHGVAKIKKIYDVVTKDVANVVWGYPAGIPKVIAFWIVFPISVFLFYKNKIEKKTYYTMMLWFIVTAGFFSVYSKPVSEYYLDSLTIIWIAFLSLSLSLLIQSKKLKAIGAVLLTAFFVYSLYRFFSYPINKSGYLERKSVVSFIKQDAAAHSYPCISISYITSPGNQLGYRYFFWLENMHVNEPKSGAPVYTIVFPLSMVDKFDKSIGALGVILPDYKKYNDKTLKQSCDGSNANIDNTMFGYTD